MFRLEAVSFSYERFCERTHFETEAHGTSNLDIMAYWYTVLLSKGLQSDLFTKLLGVVKVTCTCTYRNSLRAGSLVLVGPRENTKGRRRAGRMGRGKVSLHASF